MKIHLFTLGIALLLNSVTNAQVRVIVEPSQQEQPQNLSTLESEKIIVKGLDNQKRMAISSVVSNVAKELHSLLKEPEGYRGERPLFIEMYEKGTAQQNQGVRPRITPFEGHDLIIDLLVDARTQIDRGLLSQGVIDVLLYRRGLEGVKSLEPSQSPQVPTWLGHGLMAAIAWNHDSSDRKLYEHLLENPELFPLAQAFAATPSEVEDYDQTDKEFFRATSCAMVLAMLRQEGGEKSMSAFLEEVVLFDGEIEELIRKHFASTSVGSNAILKTWSLQLAEMATPKLTETFTMQETDVKLAELLFLVLSDEGGDSQMLPLDEYVALDGLSLKQRVQATEALRQGLIQLSNRCHPLYRPVLVEYLKLSSQVSSGKLDAIDQRLVELSELRRVFVERDTHCRDYLDWYQISRAHEVTGDFTGYMVLKEHLEAEREQRKDDTIDPYLDRIQQLMGGDY